MRASLGFDRSHCGDADARLGQWLKLPTQGVPRNADGSPNLKAPTPRLPDGKPDFSAFGTPRTGARVCPAPANSSPATASSAPRSCRASSALTCPAACPISLGRSSCGTSAPRTTPATTRTCAACPTIRRHWNLPHLTRAIHTPKLLALLYEVNAMYRQIDIDGRALPEDPTPGWMGYSTARWEGDTLVVQTEGFRDDLWIDGTGSPMGSAAKMTERIRRPNYGTLEIDVTIDDPKTYTRPFTVKLTQVIEFDTELVDEFCIEGEQSVRADDSLAGEVARRLVFVLWGGVFDHLLRAT